ncbi:MAG: DUF5667 domain-containing protein, partial [Anaerolineae bacterium]|nr:DUF5667 domain-containing protein [Anaerolineae bacterium]
MVKSLWSVINKHKSGLFNSAPDSEIENIDPTLVETAELVTHYYQHQQVPVPVSAHARLRFLDSVHEKRNLALQHYLKHAIRRRSKTYLKLTWQFIAVVAVIGLMLFPIRGQMTVAAKDSLPGDALYLVKLATEDSTVEYIEAPGVKALLTLSFADERIAEITMLAQQGREIPLSAIYRTQRLLNTALSFA